MLGVAGNLHLAVVVGVTDDSADTALATLAANPFGHDRVIPICVQGEGVYIEDAGSSRPLLSGIAATTIDVRSSVTSAAFFVVLADVSGRDLFEVDHSAVTT